MSGFSTKTKCASASAALAKDESSNPMTEKPKFNGNISLGNVLTIVAMSLGLAGTLYTQSIRVAESDGRISVVESRVDNLENDFGDGIKEIKSDIKQLETLILEIVRER